MGIEKDATDILKALVEYKQIENDSKQGRYALDGETIREITSLSPERINDAVEILENNGYIESRKVLGMHPYLFMHIEATPRGRMEWERIVESSRASEKEVHEEEIKSYPTPVGSPYGFDDQDWASVKVDKQDSSLVIVCIGLQWSSQYYDTEELIANIQSSLNRCMKQANSELGTSMKLLFRQLQGGYGGHLFNKIAREIIGSDIAIFDTSDHNANVMIEFGVALTWGVKILPIRRKGAPEIPSDISGQTWAEYEDNSITWVDAKHEEKLVEMVKFAILRKHKK
jgi:hypothetical protein